MFVATSAFLKQAVIKELKGALVDELKGAHPNNVYFCYTVPGFREIWKDKDSLLYKWADSSSTLFHAVLKRYNLWECGDYAATERINNLRLYLVEKVKYSPFEREEFEIIFIHHVERWISNNYPEHEFTSFFSSN